MRQQTILNNSFCTTVVKLLLAMLVPGAMAQQDLAAFVKQVGVGVASIQTARSDGKPLANGTGFLVSVKDADGTERRLLITNRHVMQGACAATASFPGSPPMALKSIVAEDAAIDLIAAELESIPDGVPPLRTAPGTPDPGTRIVVIGNPAGLANSVSDGLVAAVRGLEGFGTVVQITAPISPGSSGSPVFLMDGSVIGVATFQLERGQNLNFALPASRITALKFHEAVAVRAWSGEKARGLPQSPAQKRPQPAIGPTTWQEWLAVVEAVPVRPDERSFKAADPIGLLLELADFQIRIGQKEKAADTLDRIISARAVATGESTMHDEHLIACLWSLKRTIAARALASGASRPQVQASRWAQIAAAASDVHDEDAGAGAIKGIESALALTPNPAPPAAGSKFDRLKWSIDMIPRLTVLEHLVMAHAWSQDFASARTALEELAGTGRGGGAEPSPAELSARAGVAGFLAGISRFDEAEAILEPAREAATGDWSWVRGMASLASRARLMGDLSKFEKLRQSLEPRLANAELKDRCVAMEVVGLYLANNQLERGLEVAMSITNTTTKAECMQRVAVRYAQVGDRASARQVAATISERAFQMRAWVGIAKTSVATGDTDALDAALQKMELLCKEGGRFDSRLGIRGTIPIDQVVQFGYLRGIANPPGSLADQEMASMLYGELRPAFLLGLAEAAFEQEASLSHGDGTGSGNTPTPLR